VQSGGRVRQGHRSLIHVLPANSDSGGVDAVSPPLRHVAPVRRLQPLGHVPLFAVTAAPWSRPRTLSLTLSSDHGSPWI